MGAGDEKGESMLGVLAETTYEVKFTFPQWIIWIMPLLTMFGVAFYVLTSWLLYRIGKKLGYKKSEYALDPFIALFMMVDLTDREAWWVWVILICVAIPCINLIALLMIITIAMDISEKCERPRWMGILWIIPIVNWILMYILGNEESALPLPSQYDQPPDRDQPPQ